MKRTYEDYAEIINLPRHVSSKHPHMSVHDRAAQFAPFAALTGHAEAVQESARTVDSRISLGEDAIEEISEKLNFIREHIKNMPSVNITYFVPDEKKSAGGRYVAKHVNIKSTDDISHALIFTDGTKVLFDDICEIDIL